MKNPVFYTYNSDEKIIKLHPTHKMIKHFVFEMNEENELCLAHFMAKVAEKSGMRSNDLQHLFPAVLRMLKSESSWSKYWSE